MTESTSPVHWSVTIRERLLSHALDLDWSELWPEVVSVRSELLAALRDISEEQAAWKPDPAEWSIAETIRHLLPSSAGVISIIEALASGSDPGEDTPYDSPGDLTAHEVARSYDGSFASLRDALRENSIAFAALPRRLPADVDLERTFPHMYFGLLPARAWFAFQRVHDRAHLRQIEEIVASDGFPSVARS